MRELCNSGTFWDGCGRDAFAQVRYWKDFRSVQKTGSFSLMTVQPVCSYIAAEVCVCALAGIMFT